MASSYSSSIQQLLAQNRVLERHEAQLRQALQARQREQQACRQRLRQAEDQREQAIQYVRSLDHSFEEFQEQQRQIRQALDALQQASKGGWSGLLSMVSEGIDSSSQRKLFKSYQDRMSEAHDLRNRTERDLNETRFSLNSLDSAIQDLEIQIMDMRRKQERNFEEISRLRMMEAAGM